MVQRGVLPVGIKYGGDEFSGWDENPTDSSVLDGVMRDIAWLRGEGFSPVLVLSGPRGHTDRHLELLRGLTGSDLPLQYAGASQFLAIPEVMNAARVAATLTAAFGTPAVPVSLEQLGLRVAPHLYGDARISAMSGAKYLVKLLEDGIIPVIPGFQGLDPEGNVLTFSRGGTDKSAVLVAAALKCLLGVQVPCLIRKGKVPGIFTTNPHEIAEARLLASIPGFAMEVMAANGARVLHEDVQRIASKYGVTVCVGPSGQPTRGTSIVFDEGVPADCVPTQEVLTDVENGGTCVLRVQKGFSVVSAWGLLNQPGTALEILKQLGEVPFMFALSGGGADRTQVSALLRPSDALENRLAAITAKGAAAEMTDACSMIVLKGVDRTLVPALYQAFGSAGVNLLMSAFPGSKLAFAVSDANLEAATAAVRAVLAKAEVEIHDLPPTHSYTSDVYGIAHRDGLELFTVGGVQDIPGAVAAVWQELSGARVTPRAQAVTQGHEGVAAIDLLVGKEEAAVTRTALRSHGLNSPGRAMSLVTVATGGECQLVLRALQALADLGDEGQNIEAAAAAGNQISFVVAAKDAHRVLRALHNALVS